MTSFTIVFNHSGGQGSAVSFHATEEEARKALVEQCKAERPDEVIEIVSCTESTAPVTVSVNYETSLTDPLPDLGWK